MKSFFRFYGIIYIVVLVLIVSLGMVYLNQLGGITRAKLTSDIPDTTSAAGDVPLLKGAVTAPVDVNKVSIPSPEVIAKGKTLFEPNCAGCHGNEGKGDGIAGKTLNPLPRNFTNISGWKNGNKISQIYKTLQEGIPSSAMPQFNNILPEDRFAIIHYVRTFATDYPKDTPEDLKAFDVQYSLSSGFKQPNQIPVTSAMKIILDENKARNEKIASLIDKIKSDKTEKGAEIFRNMIFDLNRTLNSLFSNAKWNENESQFVNFIVVSPDQKGFKSTPAALPKEDLTVVFQYLKNLK